MKRLTAYLWSSFIYWLNWINCVHPIKGGVYGDEINFAGGRRLFCFSCGRYLEGDLSEKDVD